MTERTQFRGQIQRPGQKSEDVRIVVDSPPVVRRSDAFAVIKRSNESVSSSTTLQDDNELYIDVSELAEYNVTAFLRLGATGSTPGFKFAFSLPTGASGSFTYQVTEFATASFSDQGAGTDWTIAQAGIPITTAAYLQLFGTLTTGANAGRFQLQWAQSISDPATTRVDAGSGLQLIRGLRPE